MRTPTPFQLIPLILLTAGAAGAQVSPFSNPNVPSIDPADVDLATEAGPIDPALFSPTGVRAVSAREELEALLSRTGTRFLPPVASFGPPCTIPPCAGTDENEPCGTSSNDGCVAEFCTPAGFIDASAGGTFCGTSFADAGERDLDYYEIDSAAASVLVLTLLPEFPANLMLIESVGGTGNCDGPLVLDVVDGSICSPISITRTITAGATYHVVVTPGDANGPIFGGVPCGANNAYQLDIEILTADCLGPCTGSTELELCGNSDNEGCGTVPPGAFETFPAGGTVCGKIRTYTDPTGLPARDTDFYDISSLVSGPGAFDVTIEFSSEFPGIAVIAQDANGLGDCGATGALTPVGDEIFSGGCAPVSSTVIVTGGGTYYLFVSSGDEFGAVYDGIGDCVGPADDYIVSLSVAPSACPPLCAIPAAGTAEGESCPASPAANDTFNGGCNSGVTPLAFSDVNPGDVIQATSYADGGFRDTDWYYFEVAQTGAPIPLEITVTSQMPLVVFFVANQTNPGSLGPSSCNLNAVGSGGVNILAAVWIPGTCTPVDINAVLNPNPTIGVSNYALFIGPGNPNGTGVFSGYPCACGYGYQLGLSPLGGAACTFPTGTCEANCTDGDVVLDLDIPVAYDDLEIVVSDQSGVVVDTVNTGPLAPGPVAIPYDPPANGVYDLTLTATCAGGLTATTTCTTNVFEYIPGSDIVFDGDLGGCNDSALALATALNSAGRPVTIVDGAFVNLDEYECLASAENVWVTHGSFPNASTMSADEGATLNAGLFAGDYNLYVEGGDIWGFDAPTAFFDIDGIEGLEANANVVPDGNDLFVAMNPVAGTLVDTSGFTGPIPYEQDNRNPAYGGGGDFTDQLVASGGSDLPGNSTIETVWTNADTSISYSVTVAKDPGTDFGKVISSSFEFAGFGGDQTLLAERYLEFFVGPIGGTQFRRGDCNGDGGFNIADAITTLGILFPSGTPPVPPCRDACDANDDGGLNIADAITMLGVLFPNTSPPPVLPAPSPGCGGDPTMDPLTCDASTNGC